MTTQRDLTIAQKRALRGLLNAQRTHHALAFSPAAMRTTIASLRRRGLVSLDGRYPTLTTAGQRVAVELEAAS